MIYIYYFIQFQFICPFASQTFIIIDRIILLSNFIKFTFEKLNFGCFVDFFQLAFYLFDIPSMGYWTTVFHMLIVHLFIEDENAHENRADRKEMDDVLRTGIADQAQ